MSEAIALSPPLARFDLKPQDRDWRPSWSTIVSGALSLALVAVIGRELAGLDLGQLWRLLPASPLFWGVFVFYYVVGPLCEWIIFRRLWTIPAAGIVPLLRKKVYNELLLGYLGEAYFYGWARKRVEMTSAPFGAVKDVAILSAMAGNLATLLLLAILWPFVGVTQLGLDSHLVFGSLGVILLISIAAMFLRRRVFSLPRADLFFILRLHFARILFEIALLAALWHLALPGVAIAWWLFFATLRMLVSRLPLVPNKDLVFAGVAVFTLGREVDIGSLMALMAGVIVSAHILVGIAVVLYDLIAPEPVRR